MVEYGNGISHGPAGQVAGGGAHPAAAHTDAFASVGQFADNTWATLQTLTPLEMVGLVVVVFIGLMILRRVLF
jgi:hypothetical protein